MSVPDRPMSLPQAAFSPGRAHLFRLRPSLLPGVALLAILLIGLTGSLYALVKADRSTATAVSLHELASGEAASGVARYLQKHIPFGDTLVAADRVVNWLAVGDLGPRVRQGCPGWLFLTDELTLHRGRDDAFAGHLRIVEQVAAFLRARNIVLMVAPVPDKSRVEAAHRCGLARPAALEDRLARLGSDLRAAGIAVADLSVALNALDGERYYRTDTHWNERGARRAAEAVADTIRQSGLTPAQQAQFRIKSEPPQERVGDLIRLAGLDRVPAGLRPAGDVEAASIIEQSARADVGILDDVAAPEIVLLGTSYSRRANFAGFLAVAVGAPVENKALDGGEVTSAAMAYFASKGFADSPPRTIVWELPERFLDMPVAVADAVWAKNLAGPAAGK